MLKTIARAPLCNRWLLQSEHEDYCLEYSAICYSTTVRWRLSNSLLASVGVRPSSSGRGCPLQGFEDVLTVVFYLGDEEPIL